MKSARSTPLHSAQCTHRRWRHVALLPAPSDAQVIREGGRLAIAEFVGEARHSLHALVMWKILRPDTVQHPNNQAAWINKPQRAVVAHRHHRVLSAVAIHAVAAGAHRPLA